MFEVVKAFFRVPGPDEDALLRKAAEVLPGPGGRRIVHLREEVTVTTRHGRAVRPIGLTSFTSGDVYLPRRTVEGDRRVLDEAVRHESLHSRLTPRSRPLNYIRRMLYAHSHLYVYLEEGAAAAYGARSLRAGALYPLRSGYITPLRLTAETGVVGLVSVGALAGLAAADD